MEEESKVKSRSERVQTAKSSVSTYKQQMLQTPTRVQQSRVATCVPRGAVES